MRIKTFFGMALILFAASFSKGQAASSLREATNTTSTENPLANDVAKPPKLRGGDKTAEYTSMLPETLETANTFVEQIKNNKASFRQWILIKDINHKYPPLKEFNREITE